MTYLSIEKCIYNPILNPGFINDRPTFLQTFQRVLDIILHRKRGVPGRNASRQNIMVQVYILKNAFPVVIRREKEEGTFVSM